MSYCVNLGLNVSGGFVMFISMSRGVVSPGVVSHGVVSRGVVSPGLPLTSR